MDNGGILKIPNGHVWLEGDNPLERTADSLGELGPISKKFVFGEALFTVWPIWRISSFRDLEKYKVLLQQKPAPHSKVYNNQDIFDKYGLV